jgi:hypothetical protein
LVVCSNTKPKYMKEMQCLPKASVQKYDLTSTGSSHYDFPM